MMPLTLAALWYFTGRRDYATLACAATIAPLAYLTIRGAAQIRLSPGAIAACSAFTLLIAGTCVSWFKGGNTPTDRAPGGPADPHVPEAE